MRPEKPITVEVVQDLVEYPLRPELEEWRMQRVQEHREALLKAEAKGHDSAAQEAAHDLRHAYGNPEDTVSRNCAYEDWRAIVRAIKMAHVMASRGSGRRRA